jgi:hypothetical protein
MSKVRRTGIDIDARMFYAALVCVSTDETRYYLNGVHVEPHPEKGAVLVATDARRMIVLHDAAGYAGRTAIVSADKELVKALAAATKQPGSPRLLIDKDGIVSLDAVSYRAARNTLIEGTFIDWANVILPVLAAFRRKEVAWATFNPCYLADFGKVADRLGLNRRNTAIRVAAPDPGAAALILFAGLTNVFGVLMPMRGEIDTGVPIFMRPILSAMKKPRRRDPRPLKERRKA